MTLREEWLKFAPAPLELTGGDKWNVFLSYRSVNRSWVLNLYDVLRGLGHKVFMDQVALKAGDELTPRLEDALTSSRAGVLVWTSGTGDSDWVRREYGVLERQAADKDGFQFVPVRLDASKLPPFASNRIFLDFSTYPDGPNGGELLRLLHAIVGKPLTEEAAHFANEQDEAARAASAKIRTAIRNKSPERLVKLFREGGLPWETSAALGCRAAEGLIKLGHDEEAIKMLEELEGCFPRAIRPRQLRALALSRRGKDDDLSNAQEILGELYERGEHDPETLGIYARTWMDRYDKSGDLSDLKQSRDLYVEAFTKAPDDYYTGINAAAKSAFLGSEEDLKRAAEYAARVQKIVGTEARADDYWMTATIGEVFLLQGKYADAGRMYEAAVASARSEEGSHKSTWKQACRIMKKMQPSGAERALIRQAFEHLPDCD
ncbi:MAG: TRAFs-binding domain-containing protein [Pyrinomonadaceae bacterium]